MQGVGDVYVGAETGLLKCVQLHNGNWSNLGELKAIDRSREIVGMCWGDDDETSALLGLRSRDVILVDLATKTTREILSGSSFQNASGKFVGLERLAGSNIVTGSQSGVVSVFGLRDTELKTSVNLQLKKHQRLRRTRARDAVVATGGLNERLKLWDVNRMSDEGTSATFESKNVRNDWLNLQVRTCVQDIAFLPSSSRVVTCTGYHQVRVYDPKAQRRPVIDFSFDEFPLTAIDVVGVNPDHVIVGNSRGALSQHDLRLAGRQVHAFKGFAGGIRDVRCHPSEPLVASCGLDRFLRVHNVVNRRLVNKIYLKSRLNKLLFRRTLHEGLEEGDGGEVEEEREGMMEEEVEGDDVWNGMDEVGEGKDNVIDDDDDDGDERTKKRKATVTIVEKGKAKKKKMIKS